jgi:epoxide hydrolase
MTSTGDSAVVPFEIPVDPAGWDHLRQRLANARWPEAETVDDWSQGVPRAYLRDLCDYWANGYDWPSRVGLLNRYPQFVTALDGGGDEPVDIHFLHVTSPYADALPLLLTHGWPGSTVEFMRVIEPLVNPTVHGGSADQAFHLVIPSLPGFGYSGKPTRSGWSVDRIGTAWDQLMARLGYDRYVAQGGDWGSAVTSRIGSQNLGRCAGIHLNMPVVMPTAEDLADLTPQEMAALGKFQHYQDKESGYSKQQSTRPQTVGYGLVDSPIGQAAWVIEKFWAWTDNQGSPEDAISRDELLDNVMIFWMTASAASSARIYWESYDGFAGPPVDVPTGVSQFPKEIFSIPRRWAERHYSDLRYWNELPRGGHFAAFEQPELFVDELRSCFALVR